jgi:hypothetical protein
MSDVIDFLEKLGQDSALRYASRIQLEGALESARLDPQLQAAVMAGDREAIEAILGDGSNVCCMIFAPLEEEQEQPQPERVAA